MMSSKYSRVCAEIDMDAIAENFRIMHEAIHPETKMVAVIKTDGYGHGAVPIAQMITAGRLYLGICRRNDDRSE